MSVPKLQSLALTIRLFGPFEATLNGRPLARLRFRRSHWLLALLALRHGAEVERDWLAGLLWPEDTGHQALRNSVFNLRQALGPAVGRLRSPSLRTLALDLSHTDVDVVTFDAAVARGDPAALEEAVGLYRGPLLEGCVEAWAFQERHPREQAYLAARERLAALALERGETASAERHLQLAVAADPLRESSQRALMQTHAARGNYAAALLCYRELRLHLHRELNAEPDVETQTLFRQLRSEARRLSAKGSRSRIPGSGAGAGAGGGGAVREVVLASHPLADDRSLTTCRHNLPVQRTPLIGREQEVARALDLLRRPETGLLTLTGAGGSGKTRLALQVAADLLPDFEHGVFFVGLAPIREPGLVASAIAHTLGVRESGGQSLGECLKDYLREKQMLLLLDNFEQVLEAAPLVAELLAAAPRLKVLVTSRAALHMRGEKEFSVTPLALPDLEHLPSAEALSQIAAVELFVQRARDVKPEWAVTQENAAAVAEICARLDGLPLAIELAAARLKVLTPQALVSRLARRLPLLTGGPRDAPARQQTLRDAIAWGYDLLDETGKEFFRRLAVFAGGCTLEAAAAIGNPQGEVDALEVLASLVDMSLLQQEEVAGEPRFYLLETIREFALERLTASGEEEPIRHRHAAFFLEFAEAAEPELGVDAAWGERLEVEHDNLRAALEGCAAAPSPPSSLAAHPSEQGLRLAGALGDFWFMRGHLTEGRARLTTALAGSGGSGCVGPVAAAARAKALCAGAALALLDGDRDGAAALAEEGLTLSRQTGDRAGAARSLGMLAEITAGHMEISDDPPRSHPGDLTRAAALAKESMALYEELGHRRGAARALTALGVWAFDLGDQERGQALLDEALALSRAAGSRWQTAILLRHLAWIELMACRRERGRALLEESLEIAREFGCWLIVGRKSFHLAVWSAASGDAPRLLALLEGYLEESLALCRSQGNKEQLIWCLLSMARVALARGDPEHVRTLLDEGELVARAIEDRRARIHPLGALGHIARDLGDYERAASLYRESLPLRREHGTELEVVQSLEDLGVLAARLGQARRAARLFGATEAQCGPIGASMPVCRPAEYFPALAATKASLGEAEFAAASAEGRAMSLGESVALALEEWSTTPAPQ